MDRGRLTPRSSTGHSLDFQGAYGFKPLNSNDAGLGNYSHDSSVTDPYANTMMTEDIAQLTVVAAFDLIITDGYPSVEPHWDRVGHQYATLECLQTQAGGLLVPGGKCCKRLDNSKPVAVGSRGNQRRDEIPDVGLPKGVDVIKPVNFSTEGLCKFV